MTEDIQILLSALEKLYNKIYNSLPDWMSFESKKESIQMNMDKILGLWHAEKLIHDYKVNIHELYNIEICIQEKKYLLPESVFFKNRRKLRELKLKRILNEM